VKDSVTDILQNAEKKVVPKVLAKQAKPQWSDKVKEAVKDCKLAWKDRHVDNEARRNYKKIGHTQASCYRRQEA